MRLSISKKMWLGFSAILALLIIVCGITIFSLANVSSKYNEIIDVDMKKVELAKSIQVLQKDLGTIVLEYIMFAKDTALEKFDALENSRKIETNELIRITNDEKSLALLNELQEKNERLFASNTEILRLKQKGEPFSHLSSGSAAINSEILAILEELIEIQQVNSAQTNTDVNEFKGSIMTTVIILMSVSIVIGIIVAFVISRGIAKPVQQVTDGLEQVANGNLHVEPLTIQNKDEIGIMAQTFNKMLTDLQSIVANVRESSLHVAANAEELSASAEQSLQASKMVAQVSERQMEKSNEQGHYVDLSVTAMAELNSSVTHISDNNEVMLEATTEVQTLVEKGSAVVSDVSGQMTKIHETFHETTLIMQQMALHSDEIEKVTTLITGISEQTNLLALNADIEAARAGEYGKGFAVVAEEVRKLAEQSKQSAAEIAATVQLIQNASHQAVQAIQQGGEKVEDGLQKTVESIDVFTEIKGSVTSVVEKVQSVSAAIEQVKMMTSDVAENTDHIQTLAQEVVTSATDARSSTEEQVATTEEITINAQSLAELAEKLQIEVNHFKL